MSLMLNNEEYRSRQDIERHVRQILWGTPIGKYVTSDQFAVLTDLFRWHPDWEEKCLGQPLTAITTDLPPISYHRCFFVIRHDGTKIDISFRKAIDGFMKAHGGKRRTKTQMAADFTARMSKAT
jgi:hypothetical protein